VNGIIWARPALGDFRDVVDWLRLDSPSAALRFVDRVDEAVKRLASQPRLGRVVPELERHNIGGYRELVIAPWRLFYRIDREQVYVLAVIDGRRNVEDILLRRLLRE
jgi:toxin ParE1/3/4